MIQMTELPDLFRNLVSALGMHTIQTEDAIGFVLAESIISGEDIPQVRTSMKDGYALFGPAPKHTIIGEYLPGGKLILTGERSIVNFTLGKEETVKVSTGSPVPPGTTSVAPVECTRLVSPTEINVNLISQQASDIREIGSDVSVGQVVLERDTLITESELGALAAIGRSDVPVIRKPVVAVLSSGDELQEPWGPLKAFGVRDSNKIVLKSLLRSWNFSVIDLGIVSDE